MSTDPRDITRYHALLKVCDLAIAEATRTGADQRPELWDTISAALQDDCPKQADAALRVAKQLRALEDERRTLLSLIQIS